MGKAAGPSAVIGKMLKPTDKAEVALVRDLVEVIVRKGFGFYRFNRRLTIGFLVSLLEKSV